MIEHIYFDADAERARKARIRKPGKPMTQQEKYWWMHSYSRVYRRDYERYRTFENALVAEGSIYGD